jgi:glutamine synthetase
MDINEIFGIRVFADTDMRARMPERVYRSLKETSSQGKPLDPETADVVATAMKDWAVGKGATHYTHWFQPLNNFTAGKHDAFISHAENGKVVTEFSSSALVQGEPDASSFPSGGLRNTFEARGYTTWDPTSPAFVKDGTLYIPTAFCAYTGEALDTKTPLLRSMQALEPQARRILKLLSPENYSADCTVSPTVGAEQEYFLVDREFYEKRLDLKLCGRTLLGARPPKGQELEDHYCGRIRLRVAEFMHDLDEELWKFGITSKTKHNETAPAQHELAPIYETVNIACDHNLLTMETIRVVAKKHGLACLLHEKPFNGVNGSGKHNNYSISTDKGFNFLSPGKRPEENKLFLVTLCAFIEATDTYADLLRLAAASPGNDARLGGFEAPPAIISMFLGENLTNILESIAKGISPSRRGKGEIDMGVSILPSVKRDDSDRNRTSPFAFTGNKFEFRMLGASQSIAFINTVLNAALAESFSRFADRLEKCEKSEDIEREVAVIIADTVKKHGRVIFNGNNYSAEWVEEAKRRGLPNLGSTPEAAAAFIEPKNIELFTGQGVFEAHECHARYEIMLETFSKVRCIEAETLLQMLRREVYHGAVAAIGDTAAALNAMTAAGLSGGGLRECLAEMSARAGELHSLCAELEELLSNLPEEADCESRAKVIQWRVIPVMTALRASSDALEAIMPEKHWPIPTYTDLLHRV